MPCSLFEALGIGRLPQRLSMEPPPAAMDLTCVAWELPSNQHLPKVSASISGIDFADRRAGQGERENGLWAGPGPQTPTSRHRIPRRVPHGGDGMNQPRFLNTGGFCALPKWVALVTTHLGGYAARLVATRFPTTYSVAHRFSDKIKIREPQTMFSLHRTIKRSIRTQPICWNRFRVAQGKS